ncbi:hypothetical protein HYPSUDRAFT_208896 [Hypholoma sublateritium FD-334 SS-4]|uniref:Uncharacterized protein n=1 Tax=Hypholoma sublateritium (strain FD-334 SS-4) TaxID=945553 RepID=A0A0D2NCF9_HYPSF|nr:hypothetical protein HYPSUDRAFT_208896 [Hypholoma sublateritium FD-334 SS-4]
MYRYFRPAEGGTDPPKKIEHQLLLKSPVKEEEKDGRMYMYDSKGNFVGYGQFAPHKHLSKEKMEDKEPAKVPKSEAAAEILYRRTSDGQFVAVSQVDQPPTVFPAKVEAPTIPKQPPEAPSATLARIPTRRNSISMSDPRIKDWNGWPDGPFTCDLTFDEYQATGNLKISLLPIVRPPWSRAETLPQRLQSVNRPSTRLGWMRSRHTGS